MAEDPKAETNTKNLALVNKFQEVGWIDPFPFEVKRPKGKNAQKVQEQLMKEF